MAFWDMNPMSISLHIAQNGTHLLQRSMNKLGGDRENCTCHGMSSPRSFKCFFGAIKSTKIDHKSEATTAQVYSN